MSLEYKIIARNKGKTPSYFLPIRSRSNSQRVSLSAQHPLIQPKLAISAVDDQYEREADRVAKTVTRMPEPEIQRKPT